MSPVLKSAWRCRGPRDEKGHALGCELFVAPVGPTYAVPASAAPAAAAGEQPAPMAGPVWAWQDGDPTEFRLCCAKGHVNDYLLTDPAEPEPPAPQDPPAPQPNAPAQEPRTDPEHEPSIDRHHWLEEGASLVAGARERLIANINTIKAHLLTIVTTHTAWAVYNTYAEHLNNWYEIIVLLLPLVFASLGFTYAMLSVMTHDPAKFWPESWESSKKMVEVYLVDAARSLRWAKMWTWTAAVSVLAANISVAYLSVEKTRSGATLTKQNERLKAVADSLRTVNADLRIKWPQYEFETIYNKADNTLSLKGTFHKSDIVTFTADTLMRDDSPVTLVTDTGGRIHAGFKLVGKPVVDIRCKIEFTTKADGTTRTFSKLTKVK